MGLIKRFDRPVLLFVNENLYWFLDRDCIDRSLMLSPSSYFDHKCIIDLVVSIVKKFSVTKLSAENQICKVPEYFNVFSFRCLSESAEI